MPKQELQKRYLPSSYSRVFNSYGRSELRAVLPILRAVAHRCPIASHYPIFKLLKALSKVFLLNEVEGIFLAHLIKETDWDIRDRLITQNSQQVRDVFFYSNDEPRYRQVVLYIMLVMYTIKYYMGEESGDVLEEAGRICTGFQTVFRNWIKKHSALITKINPKMLNRVYQDLRVRMRRQQDDYHLLTDAILQISPAYSSEKQEKRKRSAEEIVKREEGEERAVKVMKVQQELQFEQNPIFSESRLCEMAGEEINRNEYCNLAHNGYGSRIGSSDFQFQGVFGSSGVMRMPLSLYREEEYCEQLNLGLQEGQSEENMNLRQTFHEVPQGNSIVLKRVFSGQRYFSFQGGSS